MNLAIEASGIEKTFTKKRSLGELLTHPFRPAERVQALTPAGIAVLPGIWTISFPISFQVESL